MLFVIRGVWRCTDRELKSIDPLARWEYTALAFFISVMRTELRGCNQSNLSSNFRMTKVRICRGNKNFELLNFGAVFQQLFFLLLKILRILPDGFISNEK